jgi:hypothetical protein
MAWGTSGEGVPQRPSLCYRHAGGRVNSSLPVYFTKRARSVGGNSAGGAKPSPVRAKSVSPVLPAGVKPAGSLEVRIGHPADAVTHPATHEDAGRRVGRDARRRLPLPIHLGEEMTGHTGAVGRARRRTRPGTFCSLAAGSSSARWLSSPRPREGRRRRRHILRPDRSDGFRPDDPVSPQRPARGNEELAASSSRTIAAVGRLISLPFSAWHPAGRTAKWKLPEQGSASGSSDPPAFRYVRGRSRGGRRGRRENRLTPGRSGAAGSERKCPRHEGRCRPRGRGDARHHSLCPQRCSGTAWRALQRALCAVAARPVCGVGAECGIFRPATIRTQQIGLVRNLVDFLSLPMRQSCHSIAISCVGVGVR